ncbi:MAG: HEPN domain-containing protein [Lachnospiraceae bacterium]|nr:HEPN domain-containing protein [Lachnospiraceae bacterium]
MEKGLNTYFGMGENDYQYAKVGMEFSSDLGNYNNVVSGFAQAAEKYLKAIIQLDYAEEDALRYLKSHNLRALLNKIKEKRAFNVSSRDCKWLGDFYFDARYPGDNFVLVNSEDAQDALRIIDDVRAETIRILNEIEEERKKMKTTLNNLKDLNSF